MISMLLEMMIRKKKPKRIQRNLPINVNLLNVKHILELEKEFEDGFNKFIINIR